MKMISLLIFVIYQAQYTLNRSVSWRFCIMHLHTQMVDPNHLYLFPILNEPDQTTVLISRNSDSSRNLFY